MNVEQRAEKRKRWMTYGIYLFGFALDFIYHLRKKCNYDL